jgi:hypothetical protein
MKPRGDIHAIAEGFSRHRRFYSSLLHQPVSAKRVISEGGFRELSSHCARRTAALGNAPGSRMARSGRPWAPDLNQVRSSFRLYHDPLAGRFRAVQPRVYELARPVAILGRSATKSGLSCVAQNAAPKILMAPSSASNVHRRSRDDAARAAQTIHRAQGSVWSARSRSTLLPPNL